MKDVTKLRLIIDPGVHLSLEIGIARLTDDRAIALHLDDPIAEARVGPLPARGERAAPDIFAVQRFSANETKNLRRRPNCAELLEIVRTEAAQCQPLSFNERRFTNQV